MDYTILFHNKTYEKIQKYRKKLKDGLIEPGSYLENTNVMSNFESLSDMKLLQYLLHTKKPQIFAESQIRGYGKDWNDEELSILGDISIAVPVQVFDNGLHHHPFIHSNPFNGTLLYTPGALIRNDKGYQTPDDREIVFSGDIDEEGYYRLYERRLLPLLYYANKYSKNIGKKAFITIPGLGCGQFAGPFRGELGSILERVLIRLLKKYKSHFTNIKAVYFDPYRECENKEEVIGDIKFFNKTFNSR